MSIQSAKLTDSICFREKIRVCGRTLREVRLLVPSFLSMTVLRQFFAVMEGYIGIYVSTMVLNGLEQGDPIKEMVVNTLFFLGVLFFMSLVSRFIEKRNNAMKETVFDRVSGRKAVKAMEMDYPELESPYMTELKNRIQDDNNWGNGLYGALLRIEYLSYQIFNVLFAIAMLIPVLHQLLKSGTVLFWLFLGVLLFMLAADAIGEGYFVKWTLFWIHKKPERPEDVDVTWGMTMDGIPQSNRKDIKLYGAKMLLKEYLERNGRAFSEECHKNMSRTDGKRATLSSILSAGVQGICYFFITLMASGGNIAVSMVVRYVACFERLTTAFQAIIRDSKDFLLVSRRHASTFEYLDAKGSLYQGCLPVEKRSDDEYEIEFRNVSFRYPGSDTYALKDFSLKLRIGERMAVVGKNGSGKTTMIKLLCRLYDPTEGEILLNGIDIRKFDYHEYMQLFSVVFQDFSLFSFSIAKNVATSEDYDAGRVRDCLIRAGFGEQLDSLKKGIETPIDKDYEDDGVLISGGERQKIAIARALYKDSPFILLDEPTAALDPLAEFEVYSAFNEMVGSKTAVYISHRLSSCRFCNDIVVFDEGKIVQRGSHEKLMEQQDGLYYTLWTSQSQYYITE